MAIKGGGMNGRPRPMDPPAEITGGSRRTKKNKKSKKGKSQRNKRNTRVNK